MFSRLISIVQCPFRLNFLSSLMNALKSRFIKAGWRGSSRFMLTRCVNLRPSIRLFLIMVFRLRSDEYW